MAAPAATSEDRILTVPNVITFVRLCLLPVFVWLLLGRENRAAAAGLLAFLGVTDFLDGWIARHYDQASNLGKVLDPVADRLIFIVGGGAILLDGSVPTWFAVLVLAAMGARRIDVTWYGKAGTFGLMFAFPLFLTASSTVSWADTAEVLAWVAAIPGLALSLYSAALYIPMARQALAEGRADRLAEQGAG